jgi:hypothetical protein
MSLAEFIRSNKERIIEEWEEEVVSRLSLELETTELIDHLPELIDDLIYALGRPPEQWATIQSAREHGRHRVQTGMDIGGLTEEISLVGEIVLALAHEDGAPLSNNEAKLLMRIIGRAAAASAQEYATIRDQELSRQAARHFSFIAHEIRNPLNNARLASALLASHTDLEGTEYLHRLDNAVSQLSELVDNALVGARLYGGPTLKPERVSAQALVDQARQDVEANAEAREIRIETDVARFDVTVDRKIIASALTNLLTNAVKFTHVGGRVLVRVRAEDDRSVWEVHDECGGLPKDLPTQLFKPFVQAGSDKSGFGLGLMIVKQAANAHHGTARVENDPGSGCRFIIELPNQPAAEAEAGVQDADQVSPG